MLRTVNLNVYGAFVEPCMGLTTLSVDPRRQLGTAFAITQFVVLQPNRFFDDRFSGLIPDLGPA
jgi:hypothetical protein